MTDRLPSLEPAAREIVARHGVAVRLQAGQQVFQPGQACTAFLIVTGGTVRVSTVTEAGRELLLYRVGAGETCVLTTACLLAEQEHDALASAETDCAALAIPKSAFDQLLAESPLFRKFVFTSYGDRLNGLIAMVQEVSLRQVDKRLARFLFERSKSGSIAMTHQAIAVELGTVREVVSRLLKHFEAEGALHLERRLIHVTDPQALEAASRSL
jgi:CRP/FNR family transcriptional regulator, anaerobic regulatory protein